MHMRLWHAAQGVIRFRSSGISELGDKVPRRTPRVVAFKMNWKPKGLQAVRLRQRKFELLLRFQIPEDLLPGSLSQVQIRLRQANLPLCCRRRSSRLVLQLYGGRERTEATYSPRMGANGPPARRGRPPVSRCRARGSRRQRRTSGAGKEAKEAKTKTPLMKTPTPRRLWCYVTRRLRLKKYFQQPGDSRTRPQIPAKILLWSMLIGQLLRECSP